LLGVTATTVTLRRRGSYAETYGAGMLELKAMSRRFAIAAGRYPLASPLARLQAQRGDVVTTLLHDSIRLEDSPCLRLLLLLDGTREREDLIAN